MTKYEIFDALAQNPVFQLATVEGDQPRVRGMLLYRADGSGIIFHTSVAKDVYKQISMNNKVELCFYCSGLQVRVTGKAELVDDDRIKDEIAEHPSRKFLKAWKENGIFEDFYKSIAVYILKNGTAVTWSMDKNFAPKEFIQL